MAFVSYICIIGSSLAERTVAPAPRDDIESLGYSLLHLASGDLPWFHNVLHRTRKTRHDGGMIDYARSLNFDELPNYELLRSQVQETRERAGLSDSFAVDWHITADASIGPSPCGHLQQICFMRPFFVDDRSPCPVPNDPNFPSPRTDRMLSN